MTDFSKYEVNNAAKLILPKIHDPMVDNYLQLNTLGKGAFENVLWKEWKKPTLFAILRTRRIICKANNH
jgi:hypothetical protein|tara:strand:- start:41 stop:247 length:207 start_codon:yes stop_codon:yes gene_type:complete